MRSTWELVLMCCNKEVTAKNINESNVYDGEQKVPEFAIETERMNDERNNKERKCNDEMWQNFMNLMVEPRRYRRTALPTE